MLRLPDIAGEGVLLLGGARAILLQVAHPKVGAGVAEHSDFANRPLDRLRATMTYIYAVVYGSEAQRAEVTRRVNQAHRVVRRTSADGRRPAYSAYDPGLQLWVAATLYTTAIQVYERVFGPLDEASADALYRDYAVLGTALQVPENAWPEDREAFGRYWHAALKDLRIGDDAQRIAWDLFHPTRAPAWLRLALRPMRFITAALLPADIRAAYRLPWTKWSGRRFDRTIRVLSAVYVRLPVVVRFWLKEHYLAALAP